MSSSSRVMPVVLVLSLLVLSDVASAQPASDVERVSNGCDLYHAVRFEEAITELEAVLAEGNLTGETLQTARVCLARAHVKAGNGDRARSLFQQVLTDDPDWRADPVVFPPDEYSVYEWVLREMGLEQEPSPPVGAVVAAQTAATTSAPAQPSRHRIGFLGGVNISNLGGDTGKYGQALVELLEEIDPGSVWGTATANSVTGALIGAFYAYQIVPNFAFRVEASFAQRGAEYQFTGFDSGGFGPIPVQVAYSYSFFEITPMAEVYLTSGKVKPVLVGGLLLGFNTKAEEEISLANISLLKDDIKELTNSTYLGFTIGAGLEIELTPKIDLELQGRYVRGITGLISDTLGDLIKVVPSDLSILAGLSFRVGS